MIIIVLVSSISWKYWQSTFQFTLVAERLFDTLNVGDLSSRDIIWAKVMDVISNNYIYGIGKTGYLLELGDFSPHNVILEVLCYTGIVGLLIFGYFLFGIVSNAYKKAKDHCDSLPLILLVPIFGMILSGQIFGQKIVWFIFAYIAYKSKISPKINVKYENNNYS